MDYAKICNHSRLKRINNDFVRCLECGESMISQKKMLTNKTRKDFTNENKLFIRNFNRNFTNILEETDELSNNAFYEYYTDRLLINKIIVNRKVQFYSDPPKFEVFVNGHKSYLTNDEIRKLLADICAIRIDENMIKK